jgi:hypothetical protein
LRGVGVGVAAAALGPGAAALSKATKVGRIGSNAAGIGKATEVLAQPALGAVADLAVTGETTVKRAAVGAASAKAGDTAASLVEGATRMAKGSKAGKIATAGLNALSVVAPTAASQAFDASVPDEPERLDQ